MLTIVMMTTTMVTIMLRCLILTTILQLLVPIDAASWDTVCPDQCLCDLKKSPYIGKKLLKTLDCEGKELTKLPDDIPEDTQVLLLSGNLFTTINRDLPQLRKLLMIDLSNNTINKMGQHPIFEKIELLRWLNLGHNAISKLNHGGFSGLLNLEVLDISNNNISEIGDHAFGGLNNLHKLSLKNNNLQTINRSWFFGLSHLQELDISGNFLINLNDGDFNKTQRLQKLNLASNNVESISRRAFQGLETLEFLDLSDNNMETVPYISFTRFHKMVILTLDNNPITHLKMGDFDRVMVKELNVNNMPNLEYIDAKVFINMVELINLQLHDNPKLMHIDPQAFVKLPKLTRLYVHNNALLSLPVELLGNLPSLKLISFYNNPVYCDCNIYWIQQTLLNTTNMSSVEFQQADKIVCETPYQFAKHILTSVPLDKIPRVCAPTVIPFFRDKEQIPVTSTVSFSCRAIGVPTPNIHWILNTRKILNGTSNHSRLKLFNSGTLQIGHVKAKDAGTYACMATNAVSHDTASMVLGVHSTNIRIITQGVSSNFITITWNGTDQTVSSTQYKILWKSSISNHPPEVIHLRPYMRTYTVTDLIPNTLYQFCISFDNLGDKEILNCADIQTKQQMYIYRGIQKYNNMAVIAALTVTISTILSVCLGAVILRRYRMRKNYKEPEGTNYKVESMSNIPLDNIYHPPSTPLCTSRTSLISNAQPTSQSHVPGSSSQSQA
ncbi:unnamed protein product [Owenia fusiformis]|uniref:Uncharacterized protein n=1 Tax=Owenia fusiformis TaxID=6347 RepID=A0A8J1XFU1_OWEFU|nr:unnamed protein product [Owenia fusiformis]